MRTMAALLLGIVASVAVCTTWLAGILYPLTQKAQPISTVGILRAGAMQWRDIAGPPGGSNSLWWFTRQGLPAVGNSALNLERGAWEATSDLPPRLPLPNGKQINWHASGSNVLAVWPEAPCDLVVEPEHRTLARLPLCPEQPHHFPGAAYAANGAAAVMLLAEYPVTYKAWRLAPGEQSWQPLNEPPVPGHGGTLVISPDGHRLLWASSAGTWAVHDGKTWHTLPPLPEQQMGHRGVITNDGTVIAAGGITDTRARAESLGTGLTLGITVAVFLAVRAIRRRFKLSGAPVAVGGMGGVLLCAAAVFALLIATGWH